MELKYPFIILIGLIGVILLFIPFKFKKKEITGIKVANTKKIKKSKIYKEYLLKYRIIINLLKGMAVLGIFISLFLLARPFARAVDEQVEYNRDIYLCMDMSASVWELNGEVVDNLKETVNALQGDRFGISIFNTTSVVLVPLTDDYQYVIDKLDELSEALDVGKEYFQASESGRWTQYVYSNYDRWDYIEEQVNKLTSGTLVYYADGTQDTTRGSSLIGDGLASCVFSFTNIDEEPDRSRIIIFTTDNDIEGTPYISITDAGSLSSRKNINLYGIGTTNITTENETEMQTAIEINGKGKYYSQKNLSVDSIIDSIEKTSKNLNKHETVVKEIELPTIPFVFLCVSVLAMVLLSKVVEK